MKSSQNLTQPELAVGACYFAFQILALPSVLSWFSSQLPIPLSDSVINFIFFLVNFIAVFVIFHRFLIHAIPPFRAHLLRCLGMALLGLFLYFLANAAFSELLLLFDPNFFNINDASIAQMAKNDFGIMFLGTVLLVPPTEEVLFRGLLFRGLYNKSRVGAYILSVLLFAAVHVLGYIGQYPPTMLLLCYLQYFPAGVILAWIYEKTNTIYTSILVHMAVNLIGLLALR